jgi:putative CocE/NonD family hydrolase
MLVLSIIFSGFAPVSATAGSKAESADYEYKVISDVMVEMSDGTQLATNIYVPAAKTGEEKEEGFPTLVSRTPYTKEYFGKINAPFFAKKGYAVVVQDTRGRYKSEGDFNFVFDDAKDGYETIEWAAEQDWSNGKIGTYGISYMAYTQYLLAKSKPPHLVTMVPLQGMSNPAEEVMFTGGAFQLDRYLSWALGQSKDTANRLDMESGDDSTEYLDAIEDALANYEEWLNHLPRKDVEPLNNVADWWVEGLNNPADGDYWKEIAPNQDYEEWPVPTYHVGGWYDILLEGTVNNFSGIAENGPEERRLEALDKNVNIQETQKMLIGPWTHGYPTTKVGPLEFPEADLSDRHNGENGAENWRMEQLRWFDYWLKGIDNEIMDEPPIELYVMEGENEGYWRYENEWPLARTKYTTYYLREGESGSIDSLNDGVLSLEAPSENEEADTYTYDPNNPTPTVGGNLTGTASKEERGPLEQGDVEKDVLTYTTTPLDEDTEITGPIKVKLWASSSAKDTDFAVKLTDVYPDGKSIIIQDSILRARYHESREEENLLEPGEIYEFTIDLGPTSNVFKKGHRIRVDVASSNYPRFDNNPNTGDEWGENANTVVAENTIYHDSKHPSQIILPVIPNEYGDVKGHWGEKAINKLKDLEVLEGFKGPNFAPNQAVSRSQFLEMLVKALNIDTSIDSGSTFSDVGEDDESYSYIEAAIAEGIIEKADYGSVFNPNTEITRGEVVEIAARALKLSPSDEGLSLTDNDQIKQNRGLITAAVKSGIIKGYPNGTIQTNKVVTRAESTVIIDRILKISER